MFITPSFEFSDGGMVNDREIFISHHGAATIPVAFSNDVDA